jgi:hypothetical protein
VRLPAVVEAPLGVPRQAEPLEVEEVQDAPREVVEVPVELQLVVTQAAQDALREAVEAPDELLAVVTQAAQDAPREVVEVPVELQLVVTQVAQDALREAAEAPDELLAVVAERDVPREAEEVRVEPPAEEVQDEMLAGVAEAVQDALREAAEARDELLAVVAEAVQDALREAVEVRVEPQAEVQPSAAEPSVALQALSLLAARPARQHKTLRLRVSVVTTSEGSRSQSLRAGRIEFVSWRPVREKQSNNVSFVSNDELVIVRRQCGEGISVHLILLIVTE